ncbi:MAG: gamma-glutamyltransferase, partial [Bacteroidetes bacterium]
GFDGFYRGRTADLIVAEMERGGGLITHEDLADYRAAWRPPVEGDYKDYHIISMPPPSSGGVALLQLLTILENYPLAQWGFHSADAVHLMVEAERRVYADRAQHLGDMDFYPVPLDSLLDPNYLHLRMADFNPGKATPSDTVAAGRFQLAVESFETTHTSVVDPQGNAVSVTTTLNLNYGSKVVVQGAGFFLNDEMDDFSAKPGTPNYFGLVGAEANAIQPGKRMLSSMTPTIVEKDGRLFLVLGAPGGSTIITAVLQVFLNVVEFGLPLPEAVEAGRFHHQWLPDEIRVERDALPDSVLQELRRRGHSFREVNRMAVIKAIQVREDGRLWGAADPRNPDDHCEGR